MTLSPARAARLVELRAKLTAPHLERCERIRAAVQAALGDSWQAGSWPIAGPGAVGISGYRVAAFSRVDPRRYMATRIDVGMYRDEVPSWQASYYASALRETRPRPNVDTTVYPAYGQSVHPPK